MRAPLEPAFAPLESDEEEDRERTAHYAARRARFRLRVVDDNPSADDTASQPPKEEAADMETSRTDARRTSDHDRCSESGGESPKEPDNEGPGSEEAESADDPSPATSSSEVIDLVSDDDDTEPPHDDIPAAATEPTTAVMSLRPLFQSAPQLVQTFVNGVAHWVWQPRERAPTGTNTDREIFRFLAPCEWPPRIVHLASNYNPRSLPFPDDLAFGRCGCAAPCRVNTCRSAVLGFYCTDYSCPFSECGNRLQTSRDLQLVRERDRNAYAVVATADIDAGVIIGEYLGELSMAPVNWRMRAPNEGYRLHFKSHPLWGNEVVCVNAIRLGSLMRFVNHSCTPSAVFHQVGSGRQHMIAVATLHTIREGDEITAFYGDKLWFKCKCDQCSRGTDDDNSE